MIRLGIFRSRFFIVGVLAAFVVLLAPIQDFGQAVRKVGALVGSLRGTDGEAAANTTIKIRNLNTGREFSVATDAKGDYRIADVDEGWYTLTVDTPDHSFTLSYGIYIKANEDASLNLTMRPDGTLQGRGSAGNAARGKSFFRKPLGIVTLVVLAGVVGLGVTQLAKTKHTIVIH